MKELYGWGDMERDDYQRERDSLTAELTTLKRGDDITDILEQAAAFLSDMPAAWRQANQEQRNQLLRLLLQEVRVNDSRVEAILPQPDFMPFFVLESLSSDSPSGSDGDQARIIDLVPLLHVAYPSIFGRHVERRGAIAAEHWPEIVARKAAGESYRVLALAFGVSHETIRAIINRAA